MTRFGIWRTAVAAVLAAVWGLVVAWLASHALAAGGAPPVGVGVVGSAVLTAATWCAVRLAATPPFELRWDGRCWHLRSAASPEPVAGDLVATVDLGHWLLLRFTPERPGATAAARWLPVQRRGLESTWHAFRCAVHSPRPPAPADAALE